MESQEELEELIERRNREAELKAEMAALEVA